MANNNPHPAIAHLSARKGVQGTGGIGGSPVVIGPGFTTNDIIEGLRVYLPPASWLVDTFFPVERLSDSNLVTLEYYKSGKTMAGFIHPQKRAINRPRKPYYSKTYEPPTVKLSRDLDAYTLAIRRIGRSSDMGTSMADAEILQEDTEELISEIRNLHEKMAADVLLRGELIIEDFDDQVELDRILFPGAPQTIQVPPEFHWTQDNVNPFDLIKSMQRLVTSKMGTSANLIIVGKDVADSLENNPIAQERYNRLWWRQGRIDPKAMESDPAVYEIGDYRGVPLYCYEMSYLDRNEAEQFYFDPDVLLV